MIKELHPLFAGSLHIGRRIDMTGLVGQDNHPGLAVFEHDRALYDPDNLAEVEQVITDKSVHRIFLLRVPQEA